MAISRRHELFPSPFLFSRLQTLIFELQRREHTLAGESGSLRPQADTDSNSSPQGGPFDTSPWKAVDSRTVGVKKSALSSSIWTVLRTLQKKGFEAYLVGGCVRDMLLKKTPKDFDVVTTANLKEINQHFHRSRVIGRQFPICQVHSRGSIVEVSSFETTHKHVKEGHSILYSQISTSCDKKDFTRWKNCMERDFTINGLFYDPFVNIIYDYVGGIRDIRTSKVRTVIPAHLSFKEDCARILRGLRIAARLGLGFSKETAAAIRDLSSSIMTLDKSRLMRELNFMLAYGAAESSIQLLQKFNLLEILLPIHAAYLAEQTRNQSGQSSIMLVKLFSNVDKVLAADCPSDCSLWLGLLAFHMALVDHPQDALVVWTFSAILYHGEWSEALRFARDNVKAHVQFIPEILDSYGTKSDESILEEVSHLASLVKSSLNALISTNDLQATLDRDSQPSQFRGLVLVSRKMGQSVARLFDVLETDIKSYAKKRKTCDINYKLLKKGDPDETRFVLGKVIMDTMNGELIHEEVQNVVKVEKDHLQLSKLF